jgi:Flp pilus assembly pilin Flp
MKLFPEMEGRFMNQLLLYVRNLMVREEGQDLVEYSLTVAIIAFGSIAGMTQLATGINDVFSTVATTLTSDL